MFPYRFYPPNYHVPPVPYQGLPQAPNGPQVPNMPPNGPQVPNMPPNGPQVPNMPPNGPIPPLPAGIPSGIESFLQSTGQFMKTAQTYAPYMQQALPMIKNIPALLRLYKGFQDAPEPQSAAPASPAPKASRKRSTSTNRPAPIESKPSLPKIYQP